MESYQPPDVPAREYRGAHGEVIPYGDRWGMGSPPDGSYSVTAHPERFAPLVEVARGLIAYLKRAYDVTVTADLALAAQVNHPRADAVDAVQIAPHGADAATLTFVFSAFPSVYLEAGVAFSDRFPFCGCDACDESVEGAARDLEEVVFGVVAGGLVESVRRETNRVAGLPVPGRRGFAFSLATEGGSRSGWSLPSDNDRAGQRAALRRIKSRGAKPWAAWNPRD
jgi:Family of unknown function (DUF6226)